MARISCQSRVARVVVYARGADVTRLVDLPADLPADPVEVALPAVSPLAQPGGIRATLTGDRAVVAVRSRLVVPAGTARGELGARVRDLEHERAELLARQDALQHVRAALLHAQPGVAIDGRTRRLDPAARLDGALAMTGLVREQVAQADARLAELVQALEHNERALADARLEAAQGTSTDRAGGDHPTREVTVHLGPGDGAVERLEVSYSVEAVRWWPAYAARIDVPAGTARLTLGAHVAQRTFEDWSDVAISLSSADLARDARLPKLASLRMGRAQPPPRTGYRAMPEGRDAMWAGYEAAVAAFAPAAAPVAAAVADVADYTTARTMPPPAAPAVPVAPAPARASHAVRAEAAPALPAKPAASPQRRRGARPPGAAAPPPPAMESAAGDWAELALASASGAGDGPGTDPQRDGDVAVAPGEEWLRFDDLRLADGADAERRGMLVRAPDAGPVPAAATRLAPPPDVRDPARTRGSYDHRYEALGVVDVPSDGRPHRVALDDAEAAVDLRLRCVPGETAEVYREAVLANPFAAPLLAGPVDVFVDGDLTRVTTIETVDRGGSLTLGLGAEERVRVARNTRVEEDSRGVLGSKTAVDHEVTIELASALGRGVDLEVVDRVPVSDDRDVEVELRASDPPADRYDQADRGEPVRGGLRWRVHLEPGERRIVRFAYRVTVPAKHEVVGGNRRE